MESDVRNEGAGEPKGGIDSAVKNEKVGAPKRNVKVGSKVQLKVDTKVDFEVQPIIVITAPVFYKPATAIGILASLVAVSVCHQPALICGAGSLLSRA